MLALQNLASEGGFWIVIAALSVVIVSAGFIFRRPLEGEAPNYSKRARDVVAFWVCIAIAMAAWWLFASMIGSH